ncbi:MAG: hypothetical protein ACLSB9_21075 [Hydrogeniiclostridium mannosilyticum]
MLHLLFENELLDSISNGGIGYELAPASLYSIWFTRNAAARVDRRCVAAHSACLRAAALTGFPSSWAGRPPPISARLSRACWWRFLCACWFAF